MVPLYSLFRTPPGTAPLVYTLSGKPMISSQVYTPAPPLFQPGTSGPPSPHPYSTDLSSLDLTCPAFAPSNSNVLQKSKDFPLNQGVGAFSPPRSRTWPLISRQFSGRSVARDFLEPSACSSALHNEFPHIFPKGFQSALSYRLSGQPPASTSPPSIPSPCQWVSRKLFPLKELTKASEKAFCFS